MIAFLLRPVAAGTGGVVENSQPRQDVTAIQTRPARAWFSMELADRRGPGRWSCGRHPVVINLRGAPAGAIAALRETLAQVNAVSGLRFYLAGRTSARPTRRWGDEPPPGTPGWPPVVVGFGWPGDGMLDRVPTEAGVASVFFERNRVGRIVIVTAAIELSRAINPLYRPGGGVSLVGLMEHELGHTVGLDHAPSSAEIMNPDVGPLHHFGPGDRAGLRVLGRGPCLSVPPPAWAR